MSRATELLEAGSADPQTKIKAQAKKWGAKEGQKFLDEMTEGARWMEMDVEMGDGDTMELTTYALTEMTRAFTDYLRRAI